LNIDGIDMRKGHLQVFAGKIGDRHAFAEHADFTAINLARVIIRAASGIGAQCARTFFDQALIAAPRRANYPPDTNPRKECKSILASRTVPAYCTTAREENPCHTCLLLLPKILSRHWLQRVCTGTQHTDALNNEHG
jgi:hypothetical protein